jgi:hypothetical protein
MSWHRQRVFAARAAASIHPPHHRSTQGQQYEKLPWCISLGKNRMMRQLLDIQKRLNPYLGIQIVHQTVKLPLPIHLLLSA